MPKPETKLKPFVEIDDGAIELTETGPYTIQFMPNGFVKVVYAGSAEVIKTWDGFDAQNLNAHASNVTFQNLSAATPLKLVNVDIVQAGSGGPLETTTNLDALLTHAALLGARPSWGDNFEAAFDKIAFDGGAAESFGAFWDLFDDNYAYYDTSVNEAFIRLGIRYAEYLDQHGGDAALDLIAKFAADGGDAGIDPDRLQTLHDNLLGNFDPVSIADKFSGNPALRDEMLQLTQDFAARGVFSGAETARGGAAHDGVRAFDWDRWGEDVRNDWLDTSFNGTVDARAQASPAEMVYGDGNPVDDWTIVRHEGAGVEVAMKVKHRGGDEYQEDANSTVLTANGVAATYHVQTGTSAPNRAEWNFDYSFTELASGDDEVFTYRILVDTDATAGVNLVEWAPNNEYGAPYGPQNSVNYGFVDVDPNTAGVQNYGFGDANFVITLQAYAGDVLVAEITSTVIVGDGIA